MTRALISAYFRSEDVSIVPIVIAELSDIQMQVLLADLVDGADHAALDDGPKAIDGLRVDRTDYALLQSIRSLSFLPEPLCDSLRTSDFNRRKATATK